MIAVRDEPGILSQTQRRRRYPDDQQRARYNNLQQSHVAEKYSLDCLISTQIFPAPVSAKLLLRIVRRIHGLNVDWESGLPVPVGHFAHRQHFQILSHARARAILTSCRSSTVRKFFW
jgi:hypothetical protein